MKFEDHKTEITVPDGPIAAQMAANAAAVQDFIDSLTLQVPLAPANTEGRLLRKLEVSLSVPQRVMVMKIFEALHNGGHKTANGRHVDKKQHVFQWMLDQLILAEERAKSPPTAETATK